MRKASERNPWPRLHREEHIPAARESLSDLMAQCSVNLKVNNCRSEERSDEEFLKPRLCSGYAWALFAEVFLSFCRSRGILRSAQDDISRGPVSGRINPLESDDAVKGLKRGHVIVGLNQMVEPLGWSGRS